MDRDRLATVLHVITGLNRGGAEGVLARLILATRAEFNHVVVVLQGLGHFGPLLRAQGIVVHALNVSSTPAALVGIGKLRALIRRERPQLVQTWLYHADLLGGIAARLAGAQAVVWCVRNNNLDAGSIGRSTRWVAWACARLSSIVPDLIVFNSKAASRSHAEFGYNAFRSRVIENGFDLEKFSGDSAGRAALRAQFGIRDDEFAIGTVARWDVQKDHANLLAALRILAPSQQKLRLLLVGTGMDVTNQELAVMLRAAGLQALTVLAGARDDIPALMNAIDLHVLPSRGEAFPNVVAEAMACGTPCVVTDVGDAAHIVGDCGWSAPACDAGALAEAIERALSAIRNHGRAHLGAACRERIHKLFSLERMTQAYLSLWRQHGVLRAQLRNST